MTAVTAVSLFSPQWSLTKFPGWVLLGMLCAMLVGLALAVAIMFKFMKLAEYKDKVIQETKKVVNG